jgi:Zn finger protein HypA/HybF involved in hydrogenase expression
MKKESLSAQKKNKKGNKCFVCGVFNVMYKGNNKYGNKCDSCHHRPYSREKKMYCENCGFKALHRAQLDVDHIDENHKNNVPENLQTLCPNCHRLKSLIAQGVIN